MDERKEHDTKFIVDECYDLEMLSETSKKSDKTANEKYRLLSPYLKKTAKFYQESWDEISKDFFSTVEKITAYPWKHTTYFCILSPFHKGLSNWGGNKIVRFWAENPYLMRKITAHELLISHMFSIFEKDFRKENLTNEQKWALAEISAFALCGLEKTMHQFWPWISKEEIYPLNHNYPQLYPLQKILKKIYKNKRNFRQFLEQSIEIVKRHFDKSVRPNLDSS